MAYLLEGSVQRVERRLRVNTQLVDARTDAHLWAQTYDRDLTDVFAIQSEIAYWSKRSRAIRSSCVLIASSARCISTFIGQATITLLPGVNGQMQP